MERANIYGFPHKGIRNVLSQLLLLSGKTDYTNKEAVHKLEDLTQEMLKILNLHLHSEEDIVLPAVEARAQGSVSENYEEHEALEKEVENIAQQIKALKAHPSAQLGAMYFSAINGFMSRYLLHMDMEETDINSVIWKNFTDEEIMSWHGQVMSTLAPDEIMLWFKYIVPALNPGEQLIIMGGFKENAPIDFYQAVTTLLKGYLTETEYTKLVT